MCGIAGYVGRRNATEILLDALARLEYRGYDSAGLAVLNGHGIQSCKLAGRVAALHDCLARTPLYGTSGIAHTRWATHGAPTEGNAHPHSDCTGTIALVHNGIIENADALREGLTQTGHRFTSETDTEVLAHLIEQERGTLEHRVVSALSHIVGTYGLAVISKDEPGKVVVARQGSPLLLGVGDGELFVASDAAAVLSHTRSVIHLNDGDVAVITGDGYQVLDREEREQVRAVTAIDWDVEDIELNGYPHYMMKEIVEQPRTVQATLRGRVLVDAGDARLNGLNLSAEDCQRFQRGLIIACGTSWHAGLVGRYLLEELAGLPVDVEYASEFRHRRHVPREQVLAIAISQSGETADTLEALRAARAQGCRVVGLVNVVGSTVARESEGGVYLHAGPEIGVASTKAFTSQVVALALMALHLGRRRGLSIERGRAVARGLCQMPELVERALQLDGPVRALAQEYAECANALYLGRSVSFPVALEGALKLKEISYIHAEGYPAAEMKHGPIALVDESLPVVFVAPQDDVFQKVLANMQEVKARGARIVAVTNSEHSLRGLADHVLPVPPTLPLLSPIVTVIPLQLLAYHIAVLRGCDVDRPRNLAKSVTVE